MKQKKEVIYSYVIKVPSIDGFKIPPAYAILEYGKWMAYSMSKEKLGGYSPKEKELVLKIEESLLPEVLEYILIVTSPPKGMEIISLNEIE